MTCHRLLRTCSYFLLLLLLVSPVAAADGVNPWKNVALDQHGDVRLMLSGQVRQRFEMVKNPDFGLDVGSDDVWMHRLLLGARLDVGDRLSAFAQLGNWAATERRNGNPSTDRNALDLAQGYIDLRLPEVAKGLTVRGGRQEMSFGSSRLVSVRESPNVRRSFDGGRVFGELGGFKADAFVARPIELQDDVFDDAADDNVLFGGLYLTSPAYEPTSFDIYYLGLERETARYSAGLGREERHSIGARMFGDEAGWDWDWEAVAQFGTFGSQQIRAWTVATDTGYTFARAMWQPRLALKADIV